MEAIWKVVTSLGSADAWYEKTVKWNSKSKQFVKDLGLNVCARCVDLSESPFLQRFIFRNSGFSLPIKNSFSFNSWKSLFIFTNNLRLSPSFPSEEHFHNARRVSVLSFPSGASSFELNRCSLSLWWPSTALWLWAVFAFSSKTKNSSCSSSRL